VPLVDLFLNRACERQGGPLSRISSGDAAVAGVPVPGNARELANVIERAVVLADHDT